VTDFSDYNEKPVEYDDTDPGNCDVDPPGDNPLKGTSCYGLSYQANGLQI